MKTILNNLYLFIVKLFLTIVFFIVMTPIGFLARCLKAAKGNSAASKSSFWILKK